MIEDRTEYVRQCGECTMALEMVFKCYDPVVVIGVLTTEVCMMIRNADNPRAAKRTVLTTIDMGCPDV